MVKGHTNKGTNTVPANYLAEPLEDATYWGLIPQKCTVFGVLSRVRQKNALSEERAVQHWSKNGLS